MDNSQITSDEAKSSDNKASQLLKSVFGYDDFREHQQDIIKDILQKKDCLVVMPTGGGKSICYQLPSLIFDGLTIVVSPLISLMHDQVSQLLQAEVKAAYINSSLDEYQYYQVLESIESFEIDILYIAPETLLKPFIVNKLARVPIDCLAIDEAHCVSDWGHDFRPEYRQLANLREKLGNPVYIALTATATARVRSDIINNLKLINQKTYVASFDRKNLLLSVKHKENTTKQILNFLNDHKQEPGIIYCFSRARTEKICDALNQNDISALPYHAGLKSEVRQNNQTQFINDKVQVIVATIAFGMGINKSNVRFIIHADLPKNIESYYQEIGRGGRDSLKATCLLLYSTGDSGKISHFINEKNNDQERRLAYEQLQVMLSYVESHGCRRKELLAYFEETYQNENCGMCDNCLAPKDLHDITIEAQKLLSCVYRTGQRFGMTYVIDILRGSRNKRILENNHQELSTYAIGKDLSSSQWKQIGRQCISQKLIFVDTNNYSILSLTSLGVQTLKGQNKVKGVIEKTISYTEKTIPTAQQEDRQHDVALLELLKSKRSELASSANVPPYIIFSDKALLEMAIFFPKSNADFLAINGVGQAKLQKYGATFMDIITGHCKSQETA